MAIDLTMLANAIGEPDAPQGRVLSLLRELAAVIRSTSNDQNVQRLARDLATAAPQLAEAVAAGGQHSPEHAVPTGIEPMQVSA